MHPWSGATPVRSPGSRTTGVVGRKNAKGCAMSSPLNSAGPGGAAPVSENSRLSYKFQRLRERLREAIVSGQLHGKLPGERELARMFKANPKTLSKALTDLAGEGLLDRSEGRGTYVKG